MSILVIGASGRIGEKLVYNLRQESRLVVEASPSFGVDTVTGVGLAKAVSDAEIVIDVSDSPSSDGEEALAFFERSGLNILTAARETGVRHVIALSIIGLDRLLGGDYFRAKKLQEDLIIASGLPYTILRSTQFFELIADLAQSSPGSDVPIPPVLVQPISSDDIADALTEIALGRPQNRTVEVAGPERLRLDELAALVLAAYEDSRRIVADSQARYFGAALGDRSLVPDEHARLASSRFEDWLRQTLQPMANFPLESRERAQRPVTSHTKV